MSSSALSTAHAARYCGVDRRTVLRWVKAGLLPCSLTGGGQARIQQADLVRFMRARGIPVPPELDGGVRIAIIDDDPNVLRLLVELIRRQVPGARVETAADGFAAGLLVASLKPDLVVLDIVMPGIDGVEVIRRLRDHPVLSETQIVVLSGNLCGDRRAALTDLGVAELFDKPLDIPRFQDLLASFAGAGASQA